MMSTEKVILDVINTLSIQKDSFSSFDELHNEDVISSFLKLIKKKDIASNLEAITTNVESLYNDYFTSPNIIEIDKAVKGDRIQLCIFYLLLIYISVLIDNDLRSKIVLAKLTPSTEAKLKYLIERIHDRVSSQLQGQTLNRKYLEILVCEDWDFLLATSGTPKNDSNVSREYSSTPELKRQHSPLKDFLQSPSFSIQRQFRVKESHLKALRLQVNNLEDENKEFADSNEALRKKLQSIEYDKNKVYNENIDLKANLDEISNAAILNENRINRTVVQQLKTIKNLEAENKRTLIDNNNVLEENSETIQKLEIKISKLSTENLLLMDENKKIESELCCSNETRNIISQLKSDVKENEKIIENYHQWFQEYCSQKVMNKTIEESFDGKQSLNLSEISSRLSKDGSMLSLEGETVADTIIDKILSERNFQFEELKKEKERLSIQMHNVEQQLASKEGNFLSLQADHSSLIERFSLMAEDMQKENGKLSALKEEHDIVLQKKISAETQLDLFSHQNETLLGKCEEYKKEAEHRENICRKDRKTISTVQAEKVNIENELDHISQENKILRDKCEEYKKEVEQCGNICSQDRHTISTFQAEVTKLQTDLKNNKEKMYDLEADSVDKQKEILMVKEDCMRTERQNKESINSLKSQLKFSQNDVTSEKIKYEKMVDVSKVNDLEQHKKYETLMKENRGFLEKIDTMKEDKNVLHLELTSWKKNYDTIRDKQINVEKELNHVSQENKNLLDKCEEFNKEAVHCQIISNEDKQTISTIEAEVTELKTELHNSKKKIYSLEADSVLKLKEILTAKEDCMKVERDFLESIDILKTQLKTSQNDVSNGKTNYERMVAILENTKTASVIQYETLKKQNDDLKDNLDQERKDKATALETNYLLDIDFQKLTEKVIELKTELDKNKQKIHGLEAGSVDRQKETFTAKEDFERMEREYQQSLENLKNQLQSSQNDVSNEKKKSEKMKINLESELDHISQENKTLLDKCEDYMKEAEHSENNCIKDRQNISTIQAEITELKCELDINKQKMYCLEADSVDKQKETLLAKEDCMRMEREHKESIDILKSQLKSSQNDYSNEKYKYETMVDVLKVNDLEHHKKYETLMKENKGFLEKMEIMKEDKNVLHLELTSWKKNYDTIRDKQINVENELDHISQEHKNLLGKCEEYKKEAEHSENNCIRDRQIISTFQAEVTELKSELDINKQKMYGLEADYVDKQKETLIAKEDCMRTEREYQESIDSLKSQLKFSQDDYSNEKNNYEKLVSELKTELITNKQKICGLEADSVDKQKESLMAKEDCMRMESEHQESIKSLKRELKSSQNNTLNEKKNREKMVAILENNKAENIIQFKVLQKENDSLKDALNQGNIEKAAALEKKFLLDNEIQKLKEKDFEHHKKYTTDGEEKKELLEKIIILKDDKNVLHLEITSLKKDYDTICNKKIKVANELDHVSHENKILLHKCEEYKKEVEHCENICIKDRQTISASQAEVIELKTELHNNQEKMYGLEAGSIDKQKETLVAMQDYLKNERKYQESIDSFKSQLKSSQNDVSNEKKKIEKMKTSFKLQMEKVMEHLKEAENFEQINIILATKYENSKKNIAELSKSLENSKVHSKTMESQVEKLKYANSGHMANEEMLSIKLKELQDERKPIVSKLTKMEQNLKVMVTERNSLQVQLQSSERMIQSMKQECSRLSIMSSSEWNNSQTLLLPKEKSKSKINKNQTKMEAPKAPVMHKRPVSKSACNPGKKSEKGTDKISSETNLRTPVRSSSSAIPSPAFNDNYNLRNSIPRTMMTYFPCEDEDDGDFCNNVQLANLKDGKLGVDSNIDLQRLSELQRRNSLCPPHLRSVYTAENQYKDIPDYSESEFRSGCGTVNQFLNLAEATRMLNLDSPHGYNLRKRKSIDDGSPSSVSPCSSSETKTKRLTPCYSRPGPPTPGKKNTIRRFDLDGSQLSAGSACSRGSKTSPYSFRTPRNFPRSQVKVKLRTPKSVKSPSVLAVKTGISSSTKKGKTPSSLMRIMRRGKSPWRKLSEEDRNLPANTSASNSKLKIFRNPFGSKNYNLLSAAQRVQEQLSNPNASLR